MLENGGATRHTLGISESLGFLPRGGELQAGAASACIPQSLSGEQSVCGLKAFLIDERRRFHLDGGVMEVDCAKVAALDISDSPVHVHGETLETYHVLAGEGRMLLGDEVLRVGPGSIMVIPPGTRHGLVADRAEAPLRVVMTFTPGLAPIQHQELRDERILAPAASAVIASLSPTHSQ